MDFTKYNQSDQIKEVYMGVACSTHRRDENIYKIFKSRSSWL